MTAPPEGMPGSAAALQEGGGALAATLVLPGTPSLAWARRRALLRDPLTVASLAILAFLVGGALVTLLLAPDGGSRVDLAVKLQPPSLAHPFGTDELGRDLWVRVLSGGRLSLASAAEVIILALLVGTLVGSLAGYAGGVIDEALMRLTDMFLAFPALVLAMAISAALGPSLPSAVLAVATVWWPWYARLTRSQVLSLRHRDFVTAARLAGTRPWRIVWRHLAPNFVSPLVVQASMDVGFAILTTAGLSFIGLGAQAPAAEWGALVSAGRTYILDQWWYATFPGLAIFLSVLAFNLLGDALRDWLDPRWKR
jgi:peptide/nickel transport system permease protein